MTRSAAPHDALFKTFLSHIETARDFLDIHLPRPLRALCKLDTLRPEPNSFIDPELRAAYSDILYSLETAQADGYIYCLIEHQSTPERLMAFRLMRYSILAMQSHLDKGHKTLPLVIPILFYHGQVRPYPYGVRWLECFADPDQARELYDGPFPLVDVTDIPDDEILTHKRAALFELVQKHIWQRDMLELLEPMARLSPLDWASGEQLKALLNYMLQFGDAADPRAFTEGLAQCLPGYEEDVMTIAERLRMEGLQAGRMEGLQAGRMEGLQAGRMEGESTVLARLLSRRFGPLPDWARERLRQADAAQLETWADAVLEASSLTGVLGAPPNTH
ncbi:MAG: Rpn family recombination-promoting nuclease/putative transposase [Azoarcus sp.]|jgi:predicted transposase/invertase (TIGR01784 family)|nr:Rpn family recombination-promoting nuclease/putative transposase [Azoarcus sp.]